MRASDERRGALLSFVDLEQRAQLKRPLRAIKPIADAARSSTSAARQTHATSTAATNKAAEANPDREYDPAIRPSSTARWIPRKNLHDVVA